VKRPAQRESIPASGDVGFGNDATEVLRSEEELRLGTEDVEVGRVRARKVVDHEHAEQIVSRDSEHADVERALPEAADSGEVETLPDGSLSIPLFEEQLIVEKRLVVRERVIIRKYRVAEDHLVDADLRRERLEIDADPTVRDRLQRPR
jgi:uncharacterized protein (TIGR02271 family)